MSDQDNVNAGDKSDQNDKGDQTDKTIDKGDKNQHMIPKSRFDQVLQQRTEAITALEEVATEMIAEIPDEFKDLVPDLPPAAKIKWIRAAIRKNLFTGPVAPNGPDSKRPGSGDKVPVNFEGMSPQAIMSQGYKTKA